MTVSIVRIESAGPDRRARRLVFDDDTTRVTSATAVKELGLEEGAVISLSALDEALKEAEPPLAKDRALRLIGYRERSAAEVSRKLRENGYPPTVVRAIIERFTELQLIDDARFAATWARSRAVAGYGSRRVARELAEKGVDPDTAAGALAEVFSASTDLDRAKAVLGGRTASTRGERDKLLRRLLSRGFDISVALQAVHGSDPNAADLD